MSPADSDPVLLVERPREGVVMLRLNRPERLNAMSAELVESLHDELSRVAVDTDCRVVVITGSGRGFCAGLDLGGYGAAPHTEDMGPTQRAFAVQKHIATLIPRLRSIPQPVIAAVNGSRRGWWLGAGARK